MHCEANAPTHRASEHTVQQHRRFCLSIQKPSAPSTRVPFSDSRSVTSFSCNGRVKFLMCSDADAVASSSSSASSSTFTSVADGSEGASSAAVRGIIFRLSAVEKSLEIFYAANSRLLVNDSHRLRTRNIVDRRALCSIEKRDNVGIYRTGKKQGEASHLLALDGRAWLLAFQNHADHRRLHRIMQSYTQ